MQKPLLSGLALLSLAACGSDQATNETVSENNEQFEALVAAAAEAKASEAAAMQAAQDAISADFSDVWYTPVGYVEFQFTAGNPDAKASALFYEDGERLVLHVRGDSIPPGPHGIHLHAVGDCSSEDFRSAGGHIGLTEAQHGLQNPEGPEDGDLRNLLVDIDGTTDMILPTRVLFERRGARETLIDQNGSAVVIHANEDDQMSQPIGGSGPRIACGVVHKIDGATTRVPDNR